jgi:hypothetical protein
MMNTMRQFALVALASCPLAIALLPVTARAAYNANMSGVPTTVATYADGDYIYLALNNQPASHPGCNPGFFVITAAVPLANRQMMLAQLLAAKFAKEPVNIGYDNSGDCADGYIRVHRVG